MRGFAGALLALAALFLLAPLLVVVLYSFNTAAASSELHGLTTRWYGETLRNARFQSAMWASLKASVIVTLLSGLVGVSGALAARFSPNPWTRRALGVLCLVPILTPELLMALGAAQMFRLIGLDLGLTTVVLAHTSFGVPLFFLLTDAALSDGRFADLIQASRDLGASGATTIRVVVLPLLAPYLASSAVLIWALSIDEFVMSFFLSGPGEPLLTVRLYSLLRTKGASTEINVACVLLAVMVLSVWLAAAFARRAAIKREMA